MAEYFYTCGCYAGGDACIGRTCEHHHEGKLCKTEQDYNQFIQAQIAEIRNIKNKLDTLNVELVDAINLATRAKKRINEIKLTE